MIDAKASSLCKGDVVGLFRYLDGMWIVTVMQILEDLQNSGSFYPNPERYDGDLRRAGINVDRMKAAMGAVLHKAAGNITEEKFLWLYQSALRGLPDQQRREIKEYWSSGSKPGLKAGTAPVSTSIRNVGFDKYLDQFTDCSYDMNYKVPADARFYYSPILQLSYADGTRIEIDISADFPIPPFDLTAAAARDAMANGRVDRGGRIFPSIIAPNTVPRLYRAREEALRMQNADYGAFASVAVNGVAFVLSVPAMPTGTAVAEAGVVVKTVRLRTGGAPQASVIGQQIAQKLPAGAQVLSQGRGHVVYRLKGEMRIRFDARGAKTLQGANPGRNHTTDNLAGVTKEGEVYVHEGRHRAIGAAKGDTIGPDLGGVSGQRHVLDFEFSEGAAESGGVYVRELSIDYTVPDVNAAEATRIWNAKNPL